MLAGLLVPLMAVPVPPLNDYPNHLARAYFLAFQHQDPALRRIFIAHWAIIPNLGVDLLLPPLMHVLPPLVAGRVLIGLAVLLPTTGAIALHAACFRRRSLWPLGAGCVAYNTMLLIGTLSFQLGAGLALWSAAAWVALASRRPRIALALGAVAAPVIFLCHLFGFGLFALLIGCFEADGLLRCGLPYAGLRRRAVLRGLMLAAVFGSPIALYLASPFAAASGVVIWPSAWKKLAHLLMAVEPYTAPAGLMISVAIGLPLVASAASRRLVVASIAWLVLPALLIAYLVLPTGAKGGYWIDTRIPVLFGFVLFALTEPRQRSGAVGATLATALAVVFAGQIAFITVIWMRQQPDVAEVRAVLRRVSPGERVLVVDGDPGQHHAGLGRTPAHGAGATYAHLGAFAFIDRQAFWSDAFTIPGQQPVMVQPGYAIGDRGLKPPRAYTRLAASSGLPPTGNPADFMNGWPARYDYVLLLQAQHVAGAATLLPQHLTLLEYRPTAVLYRVKR